MEGEKTTIFASSLQTSKRVSNGKLEKRALNLLLLRLSVLARWKHPSASQLVRFATRELVREVAANCAMAF